MRLLAPTLDRRLVVAPEALRVHLCADKGYIGEQADDTIRTAGYVPHVRPRGERSPLAKTRRHPARRWVVERTLSWLNRFRKLLVRFEKRARSYEGLLQLACALIVYRQVIVIHG